MRTLSAHRSPLPPLPPLSSMRHIGSSITGPGSTPAASLRQTKVSSSPSDQHPAGSASSREASNSGDGSRHIRHMRWPGGRPGVSARSRLSSTLRRSISARRWASVGRPMRLRDSSSTEPSTGASTRSPRCWVTTVPNCWGRPLSRLILSAHSANTTPAPACPERSCASGQFACDRQHLGTAVHAEGPGSTQGHRAVRLLQVGRPGQQLDQQRSLGRLGHLDPRQQVAHLVAAAVHSALRVPYGAWSHRETTVGA